MTLTVEQLEKILSPKKKEKILATMGDNARLNYYKTISDGFTPHKVDYEQINSLIKQCPDIAGVLIRIVEDVVGVGFYPHQINPDPDKNQIEVFNKFFSKVNPDDKANEWLENITYDLAIWHDSYWEKVGTNDKIYTDRDGVKVIDFGGKLIGIWSVDATQMMIQPNNDTGQLPEPPLPAYKQSVGSKTVFLTKNKITHIAKLKKGRIYGEPTIISLLDIIAGQINQIKFIGEKFTGKIAKKLLNFGDIEQEELDVRIDSIAQQLSMPNNPYGIVCTNIGEGYHIDELITTKGETFFIDILKYYRETIAALFGVPPVKMGWAVPGQLGGSEEGLDTWYDTIERFHRKIEAGINNDILPLLGITDYAFKFNDIRPKDTLRKARFMASGMVAGQKARQEGLLSVNDIRRIVWKEPPIPEDWANDPRYPSPVLEAKKGGGEQQPQKYFKKRIKPKELEEEEPENFFFLKKIYNLNDKKLTPENKERLRKIEEITLEKRKLYDKYWVKTINDFSKDVLKSVSKVIGTRNRKQTYITPNEYNQMLNRIETNIKSYVAKNPEMKELNSNTFLDSKKLATEGFPVGEISLDRNDTMMLDKWQKGFVMPAYENTFSNTYRNEINNVMTQSLDKNWNVSKIRSELRTATDPTKKPYIYRRIAVTEVTRAISEGHISGYKKIGYTHVEWILNVNACEQCIDVESDSPYEINKVESPPAHPLCQCTIVPFIKDGEQ